MVETVQSVRRMGVRITPGSELSALTGSDVAYKRRRKKRAGTQLTIAIYSVPIFLLNINPNF
jgi:hypothetical protein